MRYPNTIDKNIYLAYIRKENLARKLDQKLESVNLNWDLKYPESLVELCIKTIADNWASEFCVSCDDKDLLSQPERRFINEATNFQKSEMPE